MVDTQQEAPRRGVRRAIRAALVALSMAAALLVAPVFSAPANAANPADGFNPGRIIDDSQFYDGDAMSAAQVQAFLNQQVPRCRIGDPGYEPGKMTEYGSPIAATCLKDYKMTTASLQADTFCKAYAGVQNESAAQIIAKVGAACGISPRVLLVMLQKEQSLVTDDWPTTRQFDRALGFSCPDSGPNNSAACDPAQAGFFKQVYSAAWQLRNYKANNSRFGYAPFKQNTIKWTTDDQNRVPVDCGTSQVYIENWATASLYIYTPYRPNQAALDAGRGTGDKCSSYGNRNFYINYKTWFGNPVGFSVHDTFRSYWEANGSGWLGDPTAQAKPLTANGGGLMQSFGGGGVYLSNASGARVTGITSGSPIMAAFIKSGALEGGWGWPLEPAKNMGTSGNNTMRFTGGTVVESTAVGVHLVPGALVAGWEAAGGFAGSWGAPTQAAATRAGYTFQAFSKNVTGVRGAGGEVAAMPTEFVVGWTQIGPETLGLPAGSASAIAANGNGSRLNFAGGAVFSSAAGSFGVSHPQILSSYDAASGPAGAWGWPISRQACTADGKECSVAFSKGIAVWTEARGVAFTPNGAGASTGAAPGAGESVVGGAAQ